MDAKKTKRNEYVSLLSRYGGTMIFSGHEHQYFMRRIDESFAELGVNFPNPQNPGDLAWGEDLVEVKLGSSGAPWRARSYEALMEPDETSEMIRVRPPWDPDPNSNNKPYHFAVVDVWGDQATVQVFAVYEGGPVSATEATAGRRVRPVPIGSTRPLLEAIDRDGDGDPDRVRLITDRGEGQISIELDGPRPYRATLTGARVVVAGETGGPAPPDRELPHGVVEWQVVDLPQASVQIEVILQEALEPDDAYYEAGGWTPIQIKPRGDRFTFVLEDGATGDLDGEVNGRILHRGALARRLPTILPGDCNGDGKLSGRDVGCLRRHLRDPRRAGMACGDGTIRHEANRILMDVNGGTFAGDAVSGEIVIDRTDLKALRRVLRGQAEHALGSACVTIDGCPQTCGS